MTTPTQSQPQTETQYEVTLYGQVFLVPPQATHIAIDTNGAVCWFNKAPELGSSSDRIFWTLFEVPGLIEPSGPHWNFCGTLNPLPPDFDWVTECYELQEAPEISPALEETIAQVRAVDSDAADYIETQAPNLKSWTYKGPTDEWCELDGLFDWTETPQGSAYWSHIYNSIHQGKSQ